MSRSIRIAIQVSEDTITNFSIKLKKELEKESGIYHTLSDVVFVNGCLGDFNAMRENLISNGIIDERHKWLLKDKHVVVTGNCLDGSEDSVRILWLLYALESKAIREGGYVHFLPGSAEITHYSGRWRTLQPSYSPRPGSPRYAVLYDGNNELFRWLGTKNILETIGHTTVLQCNLTGKLEAFLPKFRGKRFPHAALEFLTKPLEEINEVQMETLHLCFDTPWLMVVDAGAGMVKLSATHKSGIRINSLPVKYQGGKYYYFTKKDTEPGS